VEQQEIPQRQHNPSRMTALLVAGVALVLLMLSIVAWALLDARAAARRQAEQQGGNIALTLEKDIGRTIGMLDLSLQAAVQGMATPGLAMMDPRLRQAVPFDGAIGAEGFGGIFIADETGQIIYNSLSAAPHNVNVSDRLFFQQHRDHPELGLTLSTPLHAREGGAWTLVLTRRINHPDGSFAGTAAAALRLSYFQTLFSAIDLGPHGIINLVNTDRRMVARRPYSDQDVGRDMGGSPMFGHLANSPAGSFQATASVDGITRLYSYRQVGTLPLVVGVGLSLGDIYAEWLAKAIIIGGVLLLLAATLLYLAWLLRRELLRRVRAEDQARRDAAAAQRSAQELAQAIAPLNALFSNSADTMLAVRVCPDGNFIYEAVNPVWERVNGIPAAAAIGRTPADCLPPELAAVIVPNWTNCVRQRQTTRFMFQTRHNDEPRDWDATLVPVFDKHGAEAGEVCRLIVVCREITERLRMEEQLRQSQKLEVIGRLASGVSHDFNNILQVISGGVDMLRDERGLSGQGRMFLDMVDASARRGAYLTHHLLAYSRKQMLNPKLLDLHEVLDELGIVLSRTIGTHITLTIDVAPSVGPVNADRTQFETALLNLAINAAHAMPQGGELQIAVRSAAAEPFGEIKPGRYVVIAVTDTGTGMTPDVLACIFDPFFTTKGLDGTGLGLAMVQGFSRQSGGDVRATSTPGKGSTFEIWLPELPATAAPVHPADREAIAGQGGRVLLVDDAADVLITLDAFLRLGGFTVQQANSGRRALELMTEGAQFDVLVTDYMMPGMNGLELIRQARRLQPDLPAMVVSGFAEAADFMAELPNTILLHKPFDRDLLMSQVQALFRMRPALIGTAPTAGQANG
jgi:PAS domain S-box-containing protein